VQHSKSVYLTVAYLMLVILAQAIVLPLLFGGGIAGMWLTIYFSLGAIVVALSIFGSDAPAGSRGQLEGFLIANARKMAIKNKWLRGFAMVGAAFLSMVTWPLLIVYLLFLLFRKPDLVLGDLKRRLKLRINLLAALYPEMVFLSIWLALVPAAMHVLIQFWGNEPSYFDFVATMVIIAVGLKHVLHLLGPAPTQEMLRKAKAPVALNYVTIVVCDLVALILCYNIILSTLASGTPSLAGVKDIYNRLNGFKDVFLLAFDRPKELIDYALGLSGLLWVITLAKDMLNLKGYKRTMTDRCVRTFGLAICGFEAEAKAEIETLSPETDTEIKLRAESYAALGDYPQSLRLTESFVRRKGEDRDVRGMSNAILLVSETLYHGHETERLARVVAFLEGHGLDSAQIIFAASAFSLRPADLAEVLKADGTSERLQLAKAYVLWEAGHRRAGFEALKPLAKPESEQPSGGDGEKKTLDANEACEVAVSLMMLEGLVDSKELAHEVEKLLAEYSGPLQSAIEAEVRLSVLLSLCWVLTEAADRLKGRIGDVMPVLRLSDAAFARIEPTSLSEPFTEDLMGVRSRFQPVETVKVPAAI
jgi:hypothetical protein